MKLDSAIDVLKKAALLYIAQLEANPERIKKYEPVLEAVQLLEASIVREYNFPAGIKEEIDWLVKTMGEKNDTKTVSGSA